MRGGVGKAYAATNAAEYFAEPTKSYRSPATNSGSTIRPATGSMTGVTMQDKSLCKFLGHYAGVVHQSHVELGIEPVF